MLRLKKREPEDGIQDEPLFEPSDLLSRDDVFSGGGGEVNQEADDPEDGGRDEPRGLGLLAAVPGPLIAAATFVPTFLAIFFGLSYVVGAVLQTGEPAPPATALMSDAPRGTPPPISEALRDPFVPPRLPDPPATRAGDPRETPAPSEPREVLRAPGVTELPTPAIEPARPGLPAAEPRPAIVQAPEPRVGRAAEAPRQPQTAGLNTTPEHTPPAETRKSGRDWTPAAAFADREAASRLASSIQQQGYPVEIRQETSSSRPWVVWIGAQPRAGERRR
jgi:hypothetical protein